MFLSILVLKLDLTNIVNEISRFCSHGKAKKKKSNKFMKQH